MTPDRLETLRGYKVEDIQVFLKTQKARSYLLTCRTTS